MNTLMIALQILPLIAGAFNAQGTSGLIYNMLPKRLKSKGTAEEFDTVFDSGKDFLAALYGFTH